MLGKNSTTEMYPQPWSGFKKIPSDNFYFYLEWSFENFFLFLSSGPFTCYAGTPRLSHASSPGVPIPFRLTVAIDRFAFVYYLVVSICLICFCSLSLFMQSLGLTDGFMFPFKCFHWLISKKFYSISLVHL
jgi:hypothetical protein